MSARDDAAFAESLGKTCRDCGTFEPWHAPEREGDRTSFWIADLEAEAMRLVWAECVLVSKHVSLWVEDGWEIGTDALTRTARAVDAVIYPTLRRMLGDPSLPEDGRVVVLHASLSGASGYFARANLEPPHAYPYSNARAMILLNLHHLQPGTDRYLGVLTHELQHLGHYMAHPAADAWFNEGVSMLAEDVSGYPTPGRGRQLLADPDHPLLLWRDDPSHTARDYDAAYLFVRYLADRFGLDTVAQIVQHQDHATHSIDVLLDHAGGMDGIFADWLVANLLNDTALEDGRYGYHSVDGRVAPTILDALPAAVTETVANYGADYWRVEPTQVVGLRIRFRGDATTAIGPQDGSDADALWWSRRGDGVHTLLETYIDLRDTVTATLAYRLWFDIEPGWDYGYVRVSIDGGLTWELVEPPASSRFDPLGYAFGPAYTGSSGCDLDAHAHCIPGWVQEYLVLDAYCGHDLLVRWDYVTDEAVTGAGLFVDDIAVTALTADGALIRVTAEDAMNPRVPTEIRMDWGARGFVRTRPSVAQPWQVTIVHMGDETTVHHLAVKRDGEAEWSLPPDQEAGRLVIIVAATDRLTSDRPGYHLTVEQIPQTSH